MKKTTRSWVLILMSALFIVPSAFAVTGQQEIILIASDSEGKTLKLDELDKEAANLTWNYAVSCTTTAIDDETAAANTEVFSCDYDVASKTLTIKPHSFLTGVGTLVVNEVGKDAGGTVTNEEASIAVKVIAPPVTSGEECVTWDCPLYNAFYMGVEGTSVDSVKEGGNVRIQYNAYSQIYENYLHIYGSLMQTSLKEQALNSEGCNQSGDDSAPPSATGATDAGGAVDSTVSEGTEAGAECDPEATIAGNLGVFLPLLKANGGAKQGPMAEYYLQKLDSGESFAKSYYLGWRFANSKARFFGIGYGKSEGIPGHRVKFTGQLPLYSGKIIAGLDLNVAVDNEAQKNGVSPGDSINIYLMTRVDFTKLFPDFN